MRLALLLVTLLGLAGCSSEPKGPEPTDPNVLPWSLHDQDRQSGPLGPMLDR